MIVIDKDVMVPMTDGVRLATDAFRLQEAPPSPVLLVRTPYGKDPPKSPAATSPTVLHDQDHPSLLGISADVGSSKSKRREVRAIRAVISIGS